MAGNAENCFSNRKISFLCAIKVVEVNTGGGNSSYMQRLVKGGFRRVFHAAVGKRLVFFHVKVGTDILIF